MATSFLKKHLRSLQLLLAAALVLISTESQATTYYSRISAGSFNLRVLNNWTSNADGSGTNPLFLPEFTNGANDFVIQNGNTVTCDGPLNCTSITIKQGGTLLINNNSITTPSILLEGVLNLGITPSLSLVALNAGPDNSGELVVNNGWSGMASAIGTFWTSKEVGNKVTFVGNSYTIASREYPSILIVGGTKTASQITINGNLTLTNGGSLQATGSLILVGNTPTVHQLISSNGGTLSVGSLYVYSSTVLEEGLLCTINGPLYNQADLTNNGTLTFSTNATITSNFSLINNGMLNFFNNTIQVPTGFDFTGSLAGVPNTVTYQGGSAGPIATTYRTLIISGDRYISGTPNMIADSLTLNDVTKLTNLNGTNITVNRTLTLNGSVTIDFGTNPSSLTVIGNLNGSTTSRILQNGNAGTQTLTLKGNTNTLGSYKANGNGTSSVIYSSTGTQSMFTSADYKNLTVQGGAKTVSGDIAVSGILDIINATIAINNNNLNFNTINTSTNLTTGIKTGWVVTNGTGNLIKTSTGANVLFPVGTASNVYPIQLGSVNANSSVRFGASTATPSGLSIASSWFVQNSINTPVNTSIQVSNGSNTKIIEKTSTSSWQSLPTAHTTSPVEFISASVTYGSATKELSLYNCSGPNMPTLIPVNGTTFIGLVGNSFSQQLRPSVASSTDTYTPLTALPTWLTFTKNTTGAAFSASNPTAGTQTIVVTYSNNLCEVTNTYYILINDLPTPNLFIYPIQSKTYGDADFLINSYSPSNGAITYSIANTCAQIVPNPNPLITTSNRVRITCAGPLPTNIITITATQAATSTYKSAVITQSFIISPKRSNMRLDKNTFILNTSDVITYTTNSDGPATFEQTSGTAATVLPNGSLTALSNGVFQVRISIPATNKFTAFDSTFTLTVATLPQPPLVTRDTVSLEINEQVTFSILDNASGITSAVDLNGIDIDINNFGIQTGYYVTGLGNFVLDQLGNCTYTSFGGFIGTDSIGYTVRDVNGLKSTVAYIVITIKSPVIIPPLKSNEIMTVNNDGANETLIVGNTNIDEENSITISDSNGNIVFQQDNYRNNWTGESKNGKNLEPGIYYMVFIEKESGRSLYNYVQIVR